MLSSENGVFAKTHKTWGLGTETLTQLQYQDGHLPDAACPFCGELFVLNSNKQEPSPFHNGSIQEMPPLMEAAPVRILPWDVY